MAYSRNVRIVAIDPSIASLGYSVLSGDGTILHAGFISQETDRKESYLTRAILMAQQVAVQIEGFQEEESDQGVEVLIEVPNNWFNERGTSSKDSEAVQKLYWQVGAIVGVLVSQIDCVRGVWGVIPVQWKGQVTKDVMIHRCRQFCAQQAVVLDGRVPHDTCEAIMLARFGLQLRADPDLSEGYIDPIVCIWQREKRRIGTFTHEEFINTPD